jgi:hypothetical protein
MAFRFYLQPTMAILFAIRDGLHDARGGEPAYFWSLFTADRRERHERLRAGWHGISRVFYFAVAMDVIYQLAVLQALRPLEGLIVAFVLALLPYALLRGPANRLARLSLHTHAHESPRPR